MGWWEWVLPAIVVVPIAYAVWTTRKPEPAPQQPSATPLHYYSSPLPTALPYALNLNASQPRIKAHHSPGKHSNTKRRRRKSHKRKRRNRR